jgi:hypothetical protein
LLPGGFYEVWLVQKEGGIVNVNAHSIPLVVGQVPQVDLEPAKKAFLKVVESEVVQPKGQIQLLIGLDNLRFHPLEVLELSGGMILYMSIFWN